MKCCKNCKYFCIKNGIGWCLYNRYSTNENGGAFCSYFSKK